MCFCPGALVLFRAFLKKWELAEKRFEGAKSVDGLPSVSCLRVGRWKIWKNTMCEVEQLLKLELFLNNYLLLLLPKTSCSSSTLSPSTFLRGCGRPTIRPLPATPAG